ncbi:MAG TPA: crossover junction endodeoxyribonuclease RuvC [Bacillota bacterium]|nr:crossover junction endodeoxyribonuclease RuvC [Bacillota bacterium]
MRIIGIDPGVAITGYGVVDEVKGSFLRVASGCIRTNQKLPPATRLEQIFHRIRALIGDFKPQAIALEKLFFNKNTRTALQVGEARGIVILAAALNKVDLFEYTPLQVKQAVAGYGRAEKDQVQRMVKLLLQLPQQPAVDDEADALAVALCHLQHRRWNDAVRRGGGRP